MFALSGALFLVSAANSQGTDLRPGRVTTMASLVRNESAHVRDLQAQARGLTEDVDRLSAAVDDETVQKARAQARAQRTAAGFEPVVGPGVTVTLSDTPRDVRESSDYDIERAGRAPAGHPGGRQRDVGGRRRPRSPSRTSA